MTRSVWGTDPIGKIDRAIRVAEQAEVPVVVRMHPPYRWQRAYRRWLDEELPVLEPGPAGRGDREHVPGENGPTEHDVPREPGPRRARGVAALVLDTSHAPSPSTTWSRCADGSASAAHVHLSDNAGRGGTRTCRRAKECWISMRSATTSSPTDTRGRVSLEVDLRTHPPTGPAARGHGRDAERRAGARHRGPDSAGRDGGASSRRPCADRP